MTRRGYYVKQTTFYSDLLISCVCNTNKQKYLAIRLAYSTRVQMEIDLYLVKFEPFYCLKC
jgi:hypothetical protein